MVLSPGAYDQASDIWALGCVFAELIGLSQPMMKDVQNIMDRKERRKLYKDRARNRHLFGAEYCAPLSPKAHLNRRLKLQPTDLLVHQNEVLGVPEDKVERNSFISSIRGLDL